jgi:hypothetical protein
MSQTPKGQSDLRTFAHNRWFTGKLLDAYHMQLESDAVNDKRRLLNRLVLGSGVAIGLDVRHLDDDPFSFSVTPGLAIDWHGQEIIVPKQTPANKVDAATLQPAIDQLGPPKPSLQQQARPARHGGKGDGGEHGERVWIQLRIRYKETEGDPVPADFGAECAGAMCVPGSVYEGYDIFFVPAPAERPPCQCRVPELPAAEPTDYHRLLAYWVTRHRPPLDLVPPKDPSLALANIGFHLDSNREPHGNPHIDIAVREIVYYNDVLFQLILGLAENPEHVGGK